MIFTDTPYARFNGNPACRNIHKTAYFILTKCAELLAFTYPGHQVINFGDACPLSGNCSGHPDGAHSGRHSAAIDMDYMTIEGANTTQSRKVSKGPLDIIWKDGKLVNFDWKRNFIFWRLLYTVHPKIKIAVDTRIFDFVKKEVQRNYGVFEANCLAYYLQPDSRPEFNHDTHCHIRFQL